jgi:phosphatidylethanolamine-binding protein (PEBP) family uncharacterized protein
MLTARTIALTAALLSLAPAAQAAEAFSIEFTWEGTGKCFEPQSPPFMLSHVPPGTKTLRFTMVDLDFNAFHHGGGEAPYTGNDRIPRGAVNGDYRGPCPPSEHHYEWTVLAFDAGGNILGEAKAMKPFPPE